MWRGHLLVIGLGVAGGLPLAGTQWFDDQPPHDQRRVAQPVISDHPLMPVLEFAEQAQRRLQNSAPSHRCRLLKRERIDGRLQEERAIEMCVREGEKLSVWMDFQAPAEVAGRRILYVEGEHDGRMLVRKGGRRLDFVVLRLDPLGHKAQAESLVPLTQVGFQRVLSGMVAVLQAQIEADPQAANTQVQWIEEADLDGQACQIVRITHPSRDEALGLYQATAYIDRGLGVPVRIEAYGWPDRPGDAPPLIAEYTYTNLEWNAPLADDCFDPGRLRGD